MTGMLFRIVRIYRTRFKWNYLKNEKPVLVFFFNFWNLYQILNLLKQKMSVIATSFRKLQTVPDLFRPLSKKQRFRIPFDSQHVKESQTLAKGA